MKYLLATCLTLLALTPVSAQYSETIIGEWLSADGDGKVEIYKKGDKYYGKLVWLKEPNETDGTPKVDDENPDVNKRSTPLQGLVLLRNFTFEDGFWNGGTIYDPKNGKTYKCEMWMDGKNTLRIRGYISFLHRTESWTRVN
jgi:uncharacterized protein (DUF2147 family)